jgi:transposase
MPKSVSGHELLPRSPPLTLTTVERTDAGGWIVVASGPDQALCPRCHHVSTSRHSRYVRTLTDVPAVGAAVSLRVCVGRWRCHQSSCTVRFFTGRLPGVTDVYSRRTCRADLVTQLVGPCPRRTTR